MLECITIATQIRKVLMDGILSGKTEVFGMSIIAHQQLLARILFASDFDKSGS